MKKLRDVPLIELEINNAAELLHLCFQFAQKRITDGQFLAAVNEIASKMLAAAKGR